MGARYLYMADEHKHLTVILEAQLIRQLKAAAALADKKIPQWVEEAIKAKLAKRSAA